MKTLQQRLSQEPKFLKGKALIIEAIGELGKSISGTKSGDLEYLKTLSNWVKEIRGRDLFHPAIGSGMGYGIYQEMADGSIKIDFSTNIGTYFFGHNDLDLLETALNAATKDVLMQGTLQQLEDYGDFLEILIKNSKSNLIQGWPALTGSDANDNALKIIRQKQTARSKIISFIDSFHGRNSGLVEITDNPLMREGLPSYDVSFHVPFYSFKDGEESTRKSVNELKSLLIKHKKEIAGFVFELAQGEGGFNFAPREFFIPLMEICKEEGIAIWIDEVQTCGRLGELFGYQKLGLEKYVDVVTCGKMFQNCATLWTKEYAPKPNLIAGTFGGATTSLMVGKRIIERLLTENYFGDVGKIATIEKYVKKGLSELNKKLKKGSVNQVEGIGCMISFIPNDGDQRLVDSLIHKAFDNGLIIWKAGRRPPYKIRLLLPGGVLTEEGFNQGLEILGHSIEEIS